MPSCRSSFCFGLGVRVSLVYLKNIISCLDGVERPNARFQALPEAEARHERRLEAVAYKPLFGNDFLLCFTLRKGPRLYLPLWAYGHVMPEESIAIEKYLALELLPCQHERKPNAIVRPHPVIRYLLERRPYWESFRGFLRFPVIVRGGKDIYQNGKAIRELKGEFPTLLHPSWRDAEFLLDFPHSAVKGRFTQIEPSARPVDFASAKAAFLVDQQHPARTDDKQQRRPLLRVPGGPGHVFKPGVYFPIVRRGHHVPSLLICPCERVHGRGHVAVQLPCGTQTAAPHCSWVSMRGSKSRAWTFLSSPPSTQEDDRCKVVLRPFFKGDA